MSNSSSSIASTAAQQAFVTALEGKVNSTFSSQLDGEFSVVGYPAGFHWGIQFGPNNFYNQAALNDLDLQLEMASNGVLALGGSNFSTLYMQVLNNVTYVISDADNAVIQQQSQAAASQISSVITEWENNFGTISSTQMATAVPPTKLGYIETQVQTLWGGDISKIPSSLATFENAYQSYQLAAAQMNTIMQASAAANTRLAAAKANTQNPTASNGGLQTGATAFYVGYVGMPAQTVINSGLQTSTNQVSVSLSLSDFSGSSSNLSVNGGAQGTLDVADIFTVSVGGSASFDLSKYTSSSSSVTMTITYPGITIVPAAPLNLNGAGQMGWYDNLILAEAVNNMGKGRQVTGYQVQGSQFPASFFGPGGGFSRLKTYVISQIPTTSITFTNADSSRVQSDFHEQSSVSVDLFGFIPIGGGSQSYSVQSVDASSSSGSVTVMLAPAVQQGTVPSNQATAFVLGGVASYPPNNG
ncbi:MAG TPA: hypothetical protein VGB24_13875 [Longimicrobium sp.]|jgi:hypothetical protein|uniref:hypothetical protein n=1 Tax=Longimicrobium sp. TaxID=2029185 RepID=UPI002ED92935